MVASSTPFYARRSQPPSAELGNLKNRDVHRLKKIKSWFVAVPLVLCGIDVALEPVLQRVPPSDMGISTPECR